MIGLGAKSFSVLITRLGEESRMFVDEMDGIEAVFDEENKTMVLTKTGTNTNGTGNRRPGSVNPSVPSLMFSQLTLTLLCPVVVHLSAKETAPIDVHFSLVGSGFCADNEAFTPANFVTI